mmetsp:Transcript_38256/g.120446  ORF Transcript_38256/g.120446 Transcript_38256/m.120446 type:complete len:83 (-) Transcript_38256:29-277(-)
MTTITPRTQILRLPPQQQGKTISNMPSHPRWSKERLLYPMRSPHLRTLTPLEKDYKPGLESATREDRRIRQVPRADLRVRIL